MFCDFTVHVTLRKKGMVIKMRFGKALSLFMTMLLICGSFSSCSSEKETKPDINMKESFKISEWTPEELLSSIVLDGISVPFPFTLSTLKDYDITYQDSALAALEKQSNPSLFIKHGLKDVALVGFDKLDAGGDYTTAEVTSITLNRDVNANVSLGEFKPNAAKADIINKYGEPNRVNPTNASTFTYLFGKNYITVSYDENDNVKKIQFTYEEQGETK